MPKNAQIALISHASKIMLKILQVKLQKYVNRELPDVQFSSVQSLSHVQLFVTPWIAAHQASLFITTSQSSLRLMSIELVMPSSHLILGRPLLLLPPIPPSIRVFSNESTLLKRWPNKLDFKKAEEPEIKLSTSVELLEKQESARKTSTSAFLTMPKLLTVWITINCGKFWKIWEYQTTWPAS